MAVRRTTSQQGERTTHSKSTFPGSVSGTYLTVTVHDYERNFDLPPDVQYDHCAGCSKV